MRWTGGGVGVERGWNGAGMAEEWTWVGGVGVAFFFCEVGVAFCCEVGVPNACAGGSSRRPCH